MKKKKHRNLRQSTDWRFEQDRLLEELVDVAAVEDSDCFLLCRKFQLRCGVVG